MTGKARRGGLAVAIATATATRRNAATGRLRAGCAAGLSAGRLAALALVPALATWVGALGAGGAISSTEDAAAGDGPAEAVYLLCSTEETLVEATADAVMLDRAAGRVVWMERRGGGTWRRTSYEIVARTPLELGARAERDGEAVHLTLVPGEWTFEREWPRPRAENANVWNTAEGRLGHPPGVQLFARDSGRCRVAP